MKKLKQNKCFDFAHIKLIYNFIFRLSGSVGIAELLTEKVFLMNANNDYDDIQLLRQVWEEFSKYYALLDFQGKEQIQQTLLSLAPEPRCAIILRDILGYSNGQIASVLNKSDLTVRKLISLGRQKITEYGNKQILVV